MIPRSWFEKTILWLSWPDFPVPQHVNFFVVTDSSGGGNVSLVDDSLVARNAAPTLPRESRWGISIYFIPARHASILQYVLRRRISQPVLGIEILFYASVDVWNSYTTIWEQYDSYSHCTSLGCTHPNCPVSSLWTCSSR